MLSLTSLNICKRVAQRNPKLYLTNNILNKKRQRAAKLSDVCFRYLASNRPGMGSGWDYDHLLSCIFEVLSSASVSFHQLTLEATTAKRKSNKLKYFELNFNFFF